MPIDHIDAGQLSDRVEILHLAKDDSGCHWEAVRRSWARPELQQRRNNFSTHGIGAAGVEFTIRRQQLELENAIRWNGQHCFLTGIAPRGRNHLTVMAALVEISPCLDPETRLAFPGIVTEKYLGHQQEEPMAVNTLRHVLVTPKCVVLKPGHLVRILQQPRQGAAQDAIVHDLRAGQNPAWLRPPLAAPRMGSLHDLEVNGILWPVRTAHLLDPAKNEYEIKREEEL